MVRLRILEETEAWLLDPADSAVPAQVLIHLLYYTADHPDVKTARKKSLVRGPIAQLLDALAISETTGATGLCSSPDTRLLTIVLSPRPPCPHYAFYGEPVIG